MALAEQFQRTDKWFFNYLLVPRGLLWILDSRADLKQRLQGEYMTTLTLKKNNPEQEKPNVKAWLKTVLPKPPFAIGILEDLVKIKPDRISKSKIRWELKSITRKSRYLESFELATCRNGLNDEKKEILEEHRLFANGRLFERQVADAKEKRKRSIVGCSINDLDLSPYAWQSLRNEGINFIHELVELNAVSLLRLSRVGKKTLAEIQLKLSENGLSLKR